MKTAKRIMLAGLAAILVAPTGCSKCKVCENVGGPCGIYSTAGRGANSEVAGESEGQIIMEGDGSHIMPPSNVPPSSTQMAPPMKTS